VRIAVLSLGSRGDFEPNLAAAEEFRSRGHQAVLTTNTANVARAQAAGFETCEIPADLTRILREFMASRSLVKFGVEMARFEADYGSAIDEALIAGCSGADVVVSGPMTLVRAQSITEWGGQPLVANLPYPLERSSQFHPSFMGEFNVPTVLRRPAYSVFEQVHTFSNRSAIRGIRRRLGLSDSVPNTFARMRSNRTPHVLLTSPTLFPKPSDWPDYCSIAGMPATWGDTTIDDDLESWLAGGDRPVFFGFGSMSVPDPEGLLDLIDGVSTDLGVRALVGAGWTDLPLGVSENKRVFVARSVNYSQVLPQCRAAVHHGGSGTTHDVARAGIPAVLTFVGGDQPLWGHQVEKLGIGVAFPFRKISHGRLHQALRTVLMPGVQDRAGEVAREMADENGTVQLGDTVEALAMA
jgi:sterol 3beta-glucosyltransferase